MCAGTGSQSLVWTYMCAGTNSKPRGLKYLRMWREPVVNLLFKGPTCVLEPVVNLWFKGPTCVMEPIVNLAV